MNSAIKQVIFIFTFCTSTSVAHAGGHINSWKDADGVTHFSDFGPTIQNANWTPPKRPELGRDIVHDRIGAQLQATAKVFIPKLCAQRNKGNAKQQTACEKYQRQLVDQVNTFLQSSTDARTTFHYQRCQRKWSKMRNKSFAYLVRCLGLS